MLLFFLVFLLLQSEFISATCKNGYVNGGNDKCYKVYELKSVTRSTAADRCHEDGGVLAVIQNAFINNLLRNGTSFLWFGLTCKTPSTCEYDGTTTPLSPSSYTNFYPGNIVYANSCVAMIPSDGYWRSLDCHWPGDSFACEMNSNPSLY